MMKTKIKIEELTIYPMNKPENRVISNAVEIEGDPNLINEIRHTLQRKRKQDYIFRITDTETGTVKYEYDLKRSIFESYKTYLPDLN